MATLRELGEAIARHPNRVRTILLGFDLWLEVMTSGRVKTAEFKRGGELAEGDEPEGTLKIPLMVVGRDMVVSVDLSLPPDGFRLTP